MSASTARDGRGLGVARRTVFGIDVRGRSGAWYADHASVAYVAGKTVVVSDSSSEAQRFLPLPKDVRRVSAMCAHAGTTTIAVAVVDASDSCAVVLYNAQTLKKRRALARSADAKRRGARAQPDTVVLDGLAFSDDGKSLLAYSTTTHALIRWDVEDGSSVELPEPRRAAGGSTAESESAAMTDAMRQITHAQFSPHEPNVISVICQGGVFRTYRVNASSIQLLTVTSLNKLEEDEGRELTTHAWLNGDFKHVAIGTQNGQVIVLCEKDVVCEIVMHSESPGESDEIKALPESSKDVPASVTCIGAYRDGFITAGGRGDVCVVGRVLKDRAKNKCTYKCVKRLHPLQGASEDVFDTGVAPPAIADGDGSHVSLDEERAREMDSIETLDISPSGDGLICTLKDKRSFALSLTNADIMRASEMHFKRILTEAHLDGISSMDVCLRRSIMVSASARDKSVRVWSLRSNKCEVHNEFLDSPLCVSLHPSGWMLCAGFSDKLRIMNILNNDFHVIKEISLKACRVCEFSRGGHLVATAVGATIYIHHAYTFEAVAVLRGHCGKVKSLTWNDHDSFLISSGTDGAIYEWDVHAACRGEEKCRRREHVCKGSAYTSLVVIRSTDGLIACSSDSKLKEFDEEFKVVREFSSDDVVLGHVVYSAWTHRLFASTSTGGVRAYKIPLTGEYVEYGGHAGPVTALRMSHDECRLHTAGDDGCLMVYDINKSGPQCGETAVAAPRTSNTASNTSSSDVLISQTDLNELHQHVSDLRTQVKEVSLNAQYQLRLTSAEMNEKLKSTKDEAERLLERERQRVFELEEERDTLMRNSREQMETVVAEHRQTLKEVETDYTTKMFVEVQRYEELEKAGEKAESEWNACKERLIQEYEERESNVKHEFGAQIVQLKNEIDDLQKERVSMEAEFERAREVIDAEVDDEIEQQKASFKAQLQREHERCLVLRGENGLTKSKYALVKQHEEARLQEIEDLQAENAKLAETISALKDEGKQLTEIIDAHERNIEGKNETLADSKLDMSRAEKHIAVLAKEVEVLTEAKLPLDERLHSMEQEIEGMNSELLRYYDTNSALIRQFRDMKSQKDALQREVMRVRKSSADTSALIRQFQHDLHTCTNSIQDGKALKENVNTLFERYCH